MGRDDLLRYKMKCIGKVKIIDRRFTITLTKPEAGEMEHCIYAFLVGDEIIRIGSTKNPLKKRLRSWELDVTRALKGDFSHTPKKEAKIWWAALTQHREGWIYARPGTIVTTPVGELNLYLAEESALIALHQPRCCNDAKRHRSAQMPASG